MLNLEKIKKDYLEVCEYQKGLNQKTLKAYRIDLNQYQVFAKDTNNFLSRDIIQSYVMSLHKSYKPKTAKRKIASLKAFCTYLFFTEIITENPFAKINIKYQDPQILPKTIPFTTLQKILSTAHKALDKNCNSSSYQSCLRDVAVLELLFATGIRVSELCGLNKSDIDLVSGNVKIHGKGSKERILQICNKDVINTLLEYEAAFSDDIKKHNAFFINRQHSRLSEQSVRFLIIKYAKMASVEMHITPHMFRHTFATLLLEEDVDIRYIQRMLGHSSITTTQIYTHITSTKQKEILTNKHPRNKIVL